MFSQVIINILISASLYLLIAQSYTIIYYPTKYFHLAHAGVITLGAYLSFYFVNTYRLSLVSAVFLSVCISSIVGLICLLLVYERMKKREAKSFEYLIASLGIYVIFQNIFSIWFSDSPKNLFTGLISAGHNIFGGYITNIQIAIVVSSIACFIMLSFILTKLKFGKIYLAVSNNIDLSNVYGINPIKITRFAFLFGSGIGAFAGILAGANTKILPTMGFNLLLYGIVVMIIGGIGSIRGLILAAALLASCQQIAVLLFGQIWIDAVAYLLLIVFLAIKPMGFNGNFMRKTEI